MKKYLTTAEIAKNIRVKLNKELPGCKFSVTSKVHGISASINISLMAAPFKVYARFETENGNPIRGYEQLNPYCFTYDYDPNETCNTLYLTAEAWNMFKQVMEIVYSQGIGEYTYIHLSIGKFDDPFKDLE